MYIYDTETHGECEKETDIYKIYIYDCFNILIFIYHGIDLSIILSTISYLFIYIRFTYDIYSFVTYLYNGTKKNKMISIKYTLLL